MGDIITVELLELRGAVQELCKDGECLPWTERTYIQNEGRTCDFLK
jgi:hypothetical protein